MAKKFKFTKNSEVPSGKCKGQRLCQVSNEDIHWLLMRAETAANLEMFLWEFNRRNLNLR
jgi:hypothetical protein